MGLEISLLGTLFIYGGSGAASLWDGIFIWSGNAVRVVYLSLSGFFCAIICGNFATRNWGRGCGIDLKACGMSRFQSWHEKVELNDCFKFCLVSELIFLKSLFK